MDPKLRSLMRNGISELKAGKRDRAHRLFLQALLIAPEYVPALVFAGVSAPTREAAVSYLETAERVNPDHAAVSKGWQWLTARDWEGAEAGEQQQREWVSRPLGQRKKNRQPNLWLTAGGTFALVLGVIGAFFIAVMAMFVYLNVYRSAVNRQTVLLRPSTAVQVVQAVTASPLPTFTRKPTATQTAPPSPTLTIHPTRTVTPTLTLAPQQATDLAYPQISHISFSSAPKRFAGSPLRLTGEIVGFGEAKIDGEMAFALLLGPLPEEWLEDGSVFPPVLVLGIAPDVNFNLETVLTIYGIGGDEMENLFVQGLRWDGAVLLGEGVIESTAP